jgi:hypothetical protein
LAGTNIIFEATNDFLTLGAQFSDLTSSTTPVTGLSTVPTPEAITDYFVFASPDSGFGGTGTTPANRFDFELTSLTETAYSSVTGVSSFSGAGTITDTAGGYDPTPASFTIGFSSPTNYSFTFNTVVPEPASFSLVSVGAVLLMKRRRGMHA